MPNQKNYDKRAVARLFTVQGGLATRSQLIGLGVPPSTIRHRERPGGPWRRVLKGVCASHDQALSGLGPLRAALLFAGPGSVVTGFAALRAHRVCAALQATADTAGRVGAEAPAVGAVRRGTEASAASAASAAVAGRPAAGARAAARIAAPTAASAASIASAASAASAASGAASVATPAAVSAAVCTCAASDLAAGLDPVKILIPVTRRRASAAFVLVSRTRRMPEPVEIEGCRVAPVARAAVDACLDTKDTELIRRIVGELVHTGRSSPAELRAELDANQSWQSARLRAVLVEFADGIRTGAEAQCRRQLARVAAPAPQWNRRIIEQSTGRVAVLPGAIWAQYGVALELDPSPGREPAASRRRWMSNVLRMTVAQASPGEVRDRWDEVWGELRALLNRPATFKLPPGYVFA